MIDWYTWDEADIKVKSLVSLSLGTEASRIYHQRNPHTLIDRMFHKRADLRTGYNVHTTKKHNN